MIGSRLADANVDGCRIVPLACRSIEPKCSQDSALSNRRLLDYIWQFTGRTCRWPPVSIHGWFANSFHWITKALAHGSE
jgi:hypothetical protein